MREILFRGKRIDNGIWLEGDLRHWSSGGVGIGSNGLRRTFEVIPETVGQYTGQDAIGNVPIFEGDIVWDDKEDERAVIYWDRDESKFVIEYEGWVADFSNTYGFELDVIGNIHDNPELIGGAENGKQD